MPLVIIKSDARAREKPCLRCGYSLRRIDAMHCPECGLSVWLSLNANDHLDRSNPEWLRRMALGLIVMAVAMLPALLAHGLAAKFRYDVSTQRVRLDALMRQMREAEEPDIKLLQQYQLARKPIRREDRHVWLELGGGVGFLVLFHVGLLALTSNEQRYPDKLKGWRVASWVSAGATAIVAVMTFTAVFNPVARDVSPITGQAIGVFAAIVAWAYLRALAKRIPNPKWMRACAILVLFPIASLVTVFPFLTHWLVTEIGWAIEAVVGLYFLVAAGVFVRFAMVLRHEAKVADKAWADETVLGAAKAGA